MAIGELASKVVVTYKADTSDIKAKLRELQGEEKKLAEAQLKQAEERNKGIEQQIKGIGQLTIGLELMKVAGVDLGKVFKDLTGLSGNLAAAGFAIAGPWGALAGVVAEAAKEYTVLGESTAFADAALTKARAEVEANTRSFKVFLETLDATAQRLRFITSFEAESLAANALTDAASGGARGSQRQRPATARTEPAAPERAQIGAVYSDVQFGGAVSTSIGEAAPMAGGADQRWAMDDAFQAAGVGATTDKWFAELEQLRDQPTITERMFGTVEQIDGYREAFSALTGVATSAYSALVDGNMSAGEAVKKFLADAIKGLGQRMLVRSLEETAEGVAALTSPLTAPTAAGHFKAAALFAAGSVVAGGLARSLGGSGGGGVGGGASGGGVSSGTGGAAQQQGSSPVIVYGDSFADDAPRMRQVRAKRIVEKAIGTTGVTYG